MKSKKSLVALIVITSISMTGCLEDNYQGYPNDNATGGNGGGGSTPVPVENQLSWGIDLFRQPSAPSYIESPYNMYLVDGVGTQIAVDGNPILGLDNVTLNATGDFSEFDPVEIIGSKGISTLKFSADKDYDLHITYNGNNTAEQQASGTLQFKILPTSNAQPGSAPDSYEHANFWLVMGSGANTAKVDITSAVTASMGAAVPQHIKVPMKCFADQGVDMSSVDMPFALETDGAVEYQFSEARLMANSQGPTPGQANVLSCDSKNIVLNEATSTVVKRFKKVGETTPAPEGWATRLLLIRGESISPAPSSDPVAYDGIHYNVEKGYVIGSPSFLGFIIGDATTDLTTIDTPRMDVSHYMENGMLNFNLFVPGGSTPAHEGLKMKLRFETPSGNVNGVPNKGYWHSYDVEIDLASINKNEETAVSIPIKDFFTSKADKSIRHNSAQFVEKLITFIDGSDDLSGMRYGISDINLTLNTPIAP